MRGDQFAQISGVRRHVQNGNTAGCDHAGKILNNYIAYLIANLIHGEFTIGAHDFGQEPRRVSDANCIGAIGAQTGGAKFGIAHHDWIFGAPFQIVKAGGVNVIDFGFKRAFEPMIPVVQRGHDGHIVGFQHV